MAREHVNEATIKLINSGNELAFSILYETYYVYLNAIAFYYLNNEDICREIVNDVFIKIWERRTSLIYPVHTYLIRMVQNSSIDYIRAQQSEQKVYEAHTKELAVSYQENYIHSTPEPLEYIELIETEEEIRKAIQQLTPRCQEIFSAYFNEGKSVEEIASELNITVSTVRVQMKNSYDKLRFLLKHLLFSLF